jgi:cob(I)alamin adenosyltransferase
MKGAEAATRFLKPNLVIEHTKIEGVPDIDGQVKDVEDKINQSFEKAAKVLVSGEFDMVILNGIHQMLNHGVISQDQIMKLIRNKPQNVELVLAGTGAGEELMEKAHLVTEMVCHRGREDHENSSDFEDRAPIEVVTGNGKGKTTYCLGKAMLMSCMDIRSAFLQFIKSPRAYGEVMAIEKLPCLEIETMGEGFLNMDSAKSNRRHRDAAKKTWEECLREIFSLKYGLVVLDEINIATYYGLINAERVREMLFLKPHRLHLILSGRNAHLEIRDGATSVIEMREIKHPFHQGMKARKGIEF